MGGFAGSAGQREASRSDQQRDCLLFDTTRHQIEDEEETRGGGQLCHQTPQDKMAWGDYFTPCHSVFVYRAKSVTWSYVPRVVGDYYGVGRGHSPLPGTASQDTAVETSLTVQRLQSASNTTPQREITPSAAPSSSVCLSPPTSRHFSIQAAQHNGVQVKKKIEGQVHFVLI